MRATFRTFPTLSSLFPTAVFTFHEFTRITHVPKHIKDLYSVLQVTPSANQSQIRSSYRKLAREKHPDKNPEKTNAHMEFIELKEAYDVLSNEHDRSIYDASIGPYEKFVRGDIDTELIRNTVTIHVPVLNIFVSTVCLWSVMRFVSRKIR